MESETILAHYKAKLPVVLEVDASPYGVGAGLTHEYPDESEKPIQFASQTLSNVQQKYCQIGFCYRLLGAEVLPIPS